jgi:hypothetical protein
MFEKAQLRLLNTGELQYIRAGTVLHAESADGLISLIGKVVDNGWAVNSGTGFLAFMASRRTPRPESSSVLLQLDGEENDRRLYGSDWKFRVSETVLDAITEDYAYCKRIERARKVETERLKEVENNTRNRQKQELLVQVSILNAKIEALD